MLKRISRISFKCKQNALPKKLLCCVHLEYLLLYKTVTSLATVVRLTKCNYYSGLQGCPESQNWSPFHFDNLVRSIGVETSSDVEQIPMIQQ
jgi:hypothetical protein